ncbi:hypothetical protein M3223_12505 [Paenibacillus pasadenensis]|uniref:hypothetical protein n=1 Tax=Paenibacillus pasadenensis TaxID=217090 RepID=UPI0020421271|nr:hypothetical protein [Paenibacillus pasadenensis]MCM3748176.1 hypothetical protein [Paenibacillus pasadenensis]
MQRYDDRNLGLLLYGVRAIASSRALTGDIWHAHYGAAAISAVLWANSGQLTAVARDAMLVQAEEMAVTHGIPDHFYTDKAGRLVTVEEAKTLIAEALDEGIGELHWVGHNVIYAALSLQAIALLEDNIPRSLVQDLADLICSFRSTIPGRSWLGLTTKQVKGLKPSLVTDAERSHFEEPSELSRFVLNELSRFNVIYRAEAHHDLIGHLLTFSHALNVLHDLELTEQRRKGLSAWLVLAEVLRASRNMTEQELLPLHSPVDKLPLQVALRSQLLPAEAEYWSRSYREADWDFGHTFKFASSFYEHIRRAGGSHPKAEESFRRIC